MGIGAGNRGDFGVLGRAEPGPGRFDARLGDTKQARFDPVDEGQVQDPE